MAIKVKCIEQITPGARHVWYQTEIGRIRKPIGELKGLDFSAMEEKVVLVERELLNWGRWLVKCTVGGLGYPTQSTTVRALQGSPSTASPYLPDNSEAENIESIVRRIEADKKMWAHVLRKHYTRELDETLDDVAKAIELPGRTYRYYLNMGRKKVQFYLKRS